MVASLAKGAGQPHMEAALKALNNAASDLQAAVDGKAGHRAQRHQTGEPGHQPGTVRHRGGGG